MNLLQMHQFVGFCMEKIVEELVHHVVIDLPGGGECTGASNNVDIMDSRGNELVQTKVRVVVVNDVEAGANDCPLVADVVDHFLLLQSEALLIHEPGK